MCWVYSLTINKNLRITPFYTRTASFFMNIFDCSSVMNILCILNYYHLNQLQLWSQYKRLEYRNISSLLTHFSSFSDYYLKLRYLIAIHKTTAPYLNWTWMMNLWLCVEANAHYQIAQFENTKTLINTTPISTLKISWKDQ